MRQPNLARSNNVDLLRFALASLVVFTHSYGLLDGPSAREPLTILTRGQLGFGDLAVDFFFILSGYLITASWINTGSLVRFLAKRAARIYPGIAVAILLCLILVAPLGADRPVAPFSPVTYLRSLAQLNIPVQPGVFTHQAYPGVLDLPLWTIRYEVLCYLMVAALGLCGFLKKRWITAALFAAAFALYAWQSLAGDLPMLDWRTFPVLGSLQPWPRFLAFYLAGMAFYLYRAEIPISNKYFWISAAAVALTLRAALALTLPLFGAYLLMAFAFDPSPRFPSFARRGDFSYGIYIYGCPVQQLLIHYLDPHLNPLGLFCISLPVTIAVAAASWHWIENPCLRRIHAMTPRRPARSEASSALREPLPLWDKT